MRCFFVCFFFHLNLQFFVGKYKHFARFWHKITTVNFFSFCLKIHFLQLKKILQQKLTDFCLVFCFVFISLVKIFDFIFFRKKRLKLFKNCHFLTCKKLIFSNRRFLIWSKKLQFCHIYDRCLGCWENKSWSCQICFISKFAFFFLFTKMSKFILNLWFFLW